MTIKNYSIISACTFLIALLLFAYQKEFVILNFATKVPMQETPSVAQKKKTAFFFWHQNAWHTEEIPLLFTADTSNNMQQLINRWMQLIQEENIVKKKTIVQSALLNGNRKELYLSLDRLPWDKEMDTFKKWMIIEGILKTIKNADATIKKVHFLANHQQINDTHLDFTNAWPIDGFIE